jgi:hypothetical protein
MGVLRVLALVMLTVQVSAVAARDYPALRPDHPSYYVVEQGDTLWGVSERFLEEPWRWLQVTRAEGRTDDPARLFPGDRISLADERGRPILRVERGRPLIKLSPRVREQPLPRAIPTIPVDAIRQFLTEPLVVGPGELQRSAYVVAQGERRLVSGSGDLIYAMGIRDQGLKRFGIYRPGDPYRRYSPAGPSRGEILGYEAVHVGDAVARDLETSPASLRVIDAKREILQGDRLMPLEEDEVTVNFVPNEPEFPVEGHIVSIASGEATHAARLDTVVVSVGQADGLAVGDVLEILQRGDSVRDPVTRRTVLLPEEHSGLLMLYRVFERVSFGLILESTREISMWGRVRNP